MSTDAQQTTALHFDGLSDQEAELLLARVWCILEEHQIGSPRVTVEHHPDALTDVLLTFRTEDAKIFQSVWTSDRGPRPRQRAG